MNGIIAGENFSCVMKYSMTVTVYCGRFNAFENLNIWQLTLLQVIRSFIVNNRCEQ